MILIAVCFVAVCAQASIRLPANTRPLNYNIELNVNIHNGTLPYEAKVEIKIAVDIAANAITLHNKGLIVTTARVIDKNGEDSFVSFSLDAERDFIFINVDKALIVGDEYTLEISFKGSIATSSAGFYRMSYTDVASNEIR